MIKLDGPRRLLAVTIAALAGLVDSVGFLSTDSYFVSFMSGNTTRLAVDLVSGPVRALAPIGLIAGFVGGVFIGAIVADRAGRWRKTVLLGIVAALLAIAAFGLFYGHGLLVTAPSVLAMGAINNAFAREREVSVGLTYMTGALVRLGQSLADRIEGKPLPGWSDNAILWVSLIGGAIGGAAAFTAQPALAGWLGAGLAIMLTMGAFLIERRTV